MNFPNTEKLVQTVESWEKNMDQNFAEMEKLAFQLKSLYGCSEGLQKGAKDMVEIITDKKNDEDDRVAAAITLAEILQMVNFTS